jgi:hypothetical protein
MLFGFALGGAIGIFLLALTSPPIARGRQPHLLLGVLIGFGLRYSPYG